MTCTTSGRVVVERDCLRIGRSAVGSHRHSVRLGVRMGRWQTVLVLIMTAALIGAR